MNVQHVLFMVEMVLLESFYDLKWPVPFHCNYKTVLVGRHAALPPKLHLKYTELEEF